MMIPLLNLLVIKDVGSILDSMWTSMGAYSGREREMNVM